MRSHKLKKIHNFEELVPYYNSFEMLTTFMEDVEVLPDVAFASDMWKYKKGSNFHFRFSEKEESDFINTKEMQPLKFLWKFLFYMYLSGMTNKQPVLRNGHKTIFSSMKPMIKFLSNNEIFVRNEKGLFRDSKAINTFITKDFLDELKENGRKNGTNRNYLMALYTWFNIGDFLPSFFRIYSDPLSGGLVNQHFPKNDVVPWAPIDENNMQKIIHSAIEYIEKNSKNIIQLFAVLVPVLEHDFSQSRFQYKNTSYLRVGKANRDVLIDAIIDLDFDFHSSCPLHISAKVVEKWHAGEISKNQLINTMQYGLFWDAFRILIGALSVLIFISTGMRRSEFNSLKKGCVLLDQNTEVPLMEVTVNKTSKYVEGDVHHIPIPDFIVSAVKMMEEIGEIVNPGDPRLFFNFLVNRKSNTCTLEYYTEDLIHSFQKIFFQHINLGFAPNIHRFRKTIAWYFMVNTSQAAMLLKKLFKHSSLKMVMQYMHMHPMLKREFEEISNVYHARIADTIAEATVNGKISGSKGKRILKAINNSRFKGMTGAELKQTVKQFILYAVQNKNNYIFATSKCLCMYTLNSIEKAPCMLEVNSNHTAIGIQPMPGNCSGPSCKSSVFTTSNESGLQEDYSIYSSVLDDIKKLPEEQQSKIQFARIKKEMKLIENISKDIGITLDR